MFYEENKVNEFVQCPCCKTKYIDPRIVECSSTFCMTCIENIFNNRFKGFRCPVCKDFHKKPEKGYIKNANLAKISEIMVPSINGLKLMAMILFSIMIRI